MVISPFYQIIEKYMVDWKISAENKKNKGCDIFFASKILYNKGIMVKYPWFLWIKGRGVSHDFFHF
jgi:hypothetical protein